MPKRTPKSNYQLAETHRVDARRDRQRKRASRRTMSAREIHAAVTEIIGDDMHAKRVLSLASAVDGTMAAASLSVCAIGRALADEYDLEPKYATKQVDRLLSNTKLRVLELQPDGARYVIAERKQLVVALD